MTAYEKAISAIKRMPQQITSVKDVEGVAGIGKATRDKIEEILSTGKLQKAEITSEDAPVLLLFQGSSSY